MTMKLYIHQGVFKILKHSLMYFINRGVPASSENRQSVVKFFTSHITRSFKYLSEKAEAVAIFNLSQEK